MKHRIKTKKLGRKKKQRIALMQSMAEALIENERIQTSEARAKALRPFVEKLVTKAKNSDDTQSLRRLLRSKLGGRTNAVAVLVEEIAPRYEDRPGGYTRILKLPPRESDNSPRALIEFV